METCGILVPHYLSIWCCFAAYVVTISASSDESISAQTGIDTPDLDLNKRNMKAAFHRIYNVFYDTGGSLSHEHLSQHMYRFPAASRVQVPFRDRENRSSEVIPFGKDTKLRRSEVEHVRLGLLLADCC